jgi:ubiquinone biosynthesis protein UbiJ
MLHSLNAALSLAVIERATLWMNHVLASEPVATQRLKPHAGRSIRLHFVGWPAALPPLRPAAFRVTPAGLLEWCGDDAAGDAGADPAALTVNVDASNPALAFAQALTGERPKVDISGDAAFAADLNWLADNLRWDYEDDLARVVGPVPARELARLASGATRGLRELVRSLGARAAPNTPGAGAGSGAAGSARS